MEISATAKEFIKNSIGSTVRAALVFVGGLLVKRGILTDAQNQTFVAEGTSVAIGVVMTLGALAWSYAQKWLKNRDVSKALTVSPDTSRATFEAQKASIPEAS